MPYIDIRFSFESSYDEDYDYTHHELSSVSYLSSDIDQGDREAIAETWAQGDKFFIKTTRDIIQAIDV